MKSNSLIIYHRGGGKSLGYPPNSLFTINWALGRGAAAIEYDIVTVLDAGIYRNIVIEPGLLKEAGLDIDNLNWKDVKEIDAGNRKFGWQKVATLKDVLDLTVQFSVNQQIHIKGRNTKTVDTLKKELAGFNKFVITSFDLNVLKLVKSTIQGARTGWIVKPDGGDGNEDGQDLTKLVSSAEAVFEGYTEEELYNILQSAKGFVDIIILCAPKIKSITNILFFKDNFFEMGAWGVGQNLKLARKLIGLGINRLTLDNPEELTAG